MRFFLKIVPNLAVIVDTLLCFFLLFAFYPRFSDLNFDYMGVIVAILSLLVTVLIGWNIYSLIDLKEYRRIYKELSEKMEKDINYLYNKANYHYGLSMVYNALSLAGSISDKSAEVNKFQMYLQAAGGMKILSKLNEFEHCKSITQTMLTVESSTKDIELTNEERTQIVELLKEVSCLDKIDGLFELIEINQNEKQNNNIGYEKSI